MSRRGVKGLALVVGLSALVVPASGSSLAAFTPSLHHAFGGRWSPSGKRLAFISPGPHNWSLYLGNATGSALVKLTGTWEIPQAAAWSPRGTKLAFVRMFNVSTQHETSGLWTIDTVTRGKRRLAMSSARFDLNSQLAWSPDGSRIAFTRLDERPSPAYRIYTVGTKGGRPRLLTSGAQPDWSPDGRKIVFDGATGYPSATSQVWVVNADGTGLKLLADSAGGGPTFSPDGKQIVFDRYGEVWTMNADGTGQRPLTEASESFAPQWSPDGRKLAFLRGFKRPQLYVMNADGSDQRQLDPAPGWQYDPDWSPDGTRLSYSRCSAYTLRSCGVYVAAVSG